MRTIIVGCALVFMTSTASAEVGLVRGESIRIDQRRYLCAPKADRVRARDVVLSIGDALTVGGRRLTCAEGKDKPAPPPPPTPAAPSTIELTSIVDLSCFDAIYRRVPTSFTESDARRVAATCRTAELAASCTVTQSTSHKSCYDHLYRRVPTAFDAAAAVRVEDACKQVKASCAPPSANRVTSRVDTDCFSKLERSTPSSLNAATALSFVRSCRSAPLGRCMMISTKFDQSCFELVYRKVPTSFTLDQALEVARECRTIEASCS